MAQNQINMSIVEGEPFFAHEATVNYTPVQFTLDFKCITPRTDMRSKRPSLQMKHNVVMLDPWHVKSLIKVLQSVVKNYEKEYGRIRKPKQVEKAEMRRGEQTSVTDTPAYFG